MVVDERPLELLRGAQWEFFSSEAKHPAMLGGRGSGKTVANVAKGFYKAGRYPGSRGCLTSPTYTQLRDNLLPAFRQLFGETEGELWDFRRADMEIRLRNGSLILLRPATEPDKLRGLDLGWFGMDEIAIGDQLEGFIILQGALRQEVLEEGKKVPHQGWVTSTPHWRRMWIRKMWGERTNPVTFRKLPAGEYVIYKAATSANTHLPEGFIETLRASAPSERYVRQELYGEFIDVEGVAFPQFSERRHVRPMPETAKVQKRVIGVDFGAVRPTAVIEVCLLDNGEIQGSYEFYQRGCGERQLVEAIAARPRCRVLCDPSGKELIEMLRRYGINAAAARSNNFALRYRLVASRLNLLNRGTGKVYQPGDAGIENAKPGLFLSPNQENLISEIQNLAFASNRAEMVQDKWEQGLDDHAFDALSYTLMELDPSSFKVPQITVTKRLY